jgi:hypothetical protein
MSKNIHFSGGLVREFECSCGWFAKGSMREVNYKTRLHFRFCEIMTEGEKNEVLENMSTSKPSKDGNHKSKFNEKTNRYDLNETLYESPQITDSASSSTGNPEQVNYFNELIAEEEAQKASSSSKKKKSKK